MLITNKTAHEAEYILFGGPANMTLSKGWVEPGESDEWQSPFVGLEVDCTIHRTINGETIVRSLHSSDTLRIEESEGGVSLIGGEEAS